LFSSSGLLGKKKVRRVYLPDHKQLDVPLAVVTIHDACPAFSSKIFRFTEELEGLGIKYMYIRRKMADPYTYHMLKGSSFEWRNSIDA
jgi:hypothetical protein